jgi:hypothetical protein
MEKLAVFLICLYFAVGLVVLGFIGWVIVMLLKHFGVV